MKKVRIHRHQTTCSVVFHVVTILLLLGLSLPMAAQDSLYARRMIRDLTSPSMFGRGMQHRGDSIAAAYLRQEFRAIGVKPLCKDYYQYFRFPMTRTTPPIVKSGYRSQNVCGYLPGSSDTMIVFTAHYEHLGMSGDTIFFGAHDNASGTAAVMDLARIYSQQPHHYTYVFLLFGGEESGLVGSSFFADVPLVSLQKVKLLVNIDLFCGGDDGLMVVNANDDRTRQYVDILDDVNAKHGYAAKIGRRNNAPNSDHYHFTSLCPAIFIYTLGGPYGGYHSPDDKCESCGLGHYHDFLLLIRSMLEAIEAL